MMRYTPFDVMERMVEQMRRDMLEFREGVWDSGRWDDRPALEGDYESTAPALATSGRFNVDLTEHDGEFVFTADLPGFEKNEIDLRLDGDDLVVSATHEASDESSSRRRSISERVTLGKPVVEEEISASYRNGVLEVHLPIVEGAAERGHRIDID